MTLLLEIARCPDVLYCLTTNDQSHPCSRIVHSQLPQEAEEFQVPEPWSGQIERAPILFVSSNPSWSPNRPDQYPRLDWNDEDIENYFTFRFGGHELSTISGGIYDQLPGRERPSRGVAYWIAVRARAAELYGREPKEIVAGKDYALTEVVRCKSVGEVGVQEAVATCAERYLEPTFVLSPARVVIFLGGTLKGK